MPRTWEEDGEEVVDNFAPTPPYVYNRTKCFLPSIPLEKIKVLLTCTKSNKVRNGLFCSVLRDAKLKNLLAFLHPFRFFFQLLLISLIEG